MIIEILELRVKLLAQVCNKICQSVKSLPAKELNILDLSDTALPS